MPETTEPQLTEGEVAEIEARLASIVDPLPSIQMAAALCHTVKAAWADRNTWQQTAETLAEENAALREQLNAAADLEMLARDETSALREQLAEAEKERELCRQVQKRGIHSSVTCACVIAMEKE